MAADTSSLPTTERQSETRELPSQLLRREAKLQRSNGVHADQMDEEDEDTTTAIGGQAQETEYFMTE